MSLDQDSKEIVIFIILKINRIIFNGSAACVPQQFEYFDARKDRKDIRHLSPCRSLQLLADKLVAGFFYPTRTFKIAYKGPFCSNLTSRVRSISARTSYACNNEVAKL